MKVDVIARLRVLLGDQYHAGSILKELLQNADDANATCVHIGLHPGWPGNPHPLLRSRLLLVLNDGEFLPGHARAVHYLDAGSKASGSVGRFGLGMKSVFHLCEAAFYSVSKNQPGAECDAVRLINPWEDSERELHRSWTHHEVAARVFLQEYLASWSHGCARWFCLIIPIRTQEHVADNTPIRSVPREEQVTACLDPEKATALMPLLRHTASVTTWSTKGDAMVRTFRVEHSKDYQRCQFPVLQEIQRAPVKGTLSCLDARGRPAWQGVIAGQQFVSSDDTLRSLQQHPEWPRHEVFDPETAESRTVQRRDQPHCAAVFSVIPAEKKRGRFTLHHGAFFPLDLDAPLRNDLLECACQVQLLIHGVFFVDSGRQRLHKGEFEKCWNDALESEALALIPGALSELESYGVVEMMPLVKALLKASDKLPLGKVCRLEHWVPRISPDDALQCRWELVGKATHFFTLPAPPEGRQGLLFDLFAGARSLCEDRLVTCDDWPRLAASPPDPWPAEDIAELLSTTSANVLLTEGVEALSYFRGILKAAMDGETLPSSVGARVASVLVSLLSSSGEELAKEKRRIVLDIAGLLPPQVGPDDTLLPTDWRARLKFGGLRFEAGQWRRATFTADELRAKMKSGRLFSASEQSKTLAKVVQGALCEHCLVLLDKLESRVVMQEPVSDFGDRECVVLLAREDAPALRPQAAERLPLLRRVVAACVEHDEAWRCAVRYLLHGRSDKRDDSSELVLPAPNVEVARCTLIRELFAATDSEWRIVSSDLAQSVTPVHDDLPSVEWLDVTRHLESALESVIDAGHLHERWRLILKALKQHSCARIESRDLKNKLRETNWLPRQDGLTVAPKSVVNLPVVAAHLETWLRDSPNTTTVGRLLSECRSDPHSVDWALASTEESLALLGKGLAECSEYALGSLAQGTVDRDGFADLFEGAPINVMPVWPIMKEIRRSYPAHWLRCASELLRPISAERLLLVLEHLADLDQADFHKAYLSGSVEDPDFMRDILRRIRLRNRDGRWMDSGRLCAGVLGIDGASVLAADLQAILVRCAHSNANKFTQSRADGNPPYLPGSIDGALDQTAREIRSFCAAWERAGVQRVQMGVFLSALGEAEEIKALAEEYLRGNRSGLHWERVRQQLGLAPEKRHHGLVVHFNRDRQARVVNLLGASMDVALSAQYDDLVVTDDHEGVWPVRARGLHPIYRLTFRGVPPPDPVRAGRLLLATAKAVIARISPGGNVGSLGRIWEAAAKGWDIQVAQRYILDSAIPYIRHGMDVELPPQMLAALKEIEAAEEEEQEFLMLGQSGDQARGRRDTAQHQLRSLLQDDDAVQTAMLEGIRLSMRRRYSYAPASIPFELFQNADDAAAELGELTADTAGADTLVVEVVTDCIRFMHWGRPINRAAGEKLGPDQGRERGYHNDLKKMLMLSWSDKGEAGGAERQVTGKFGLGFKSVFLVADRPRILSDRVAFDIRGGFWPVPIGGDEYLRLAAMPAEALKMMGCGKPERGGQGTVLELPTDDDGILDRFRTHLPILLVFAKRIKRCRVSSEKQGSADLQWQCRPLSHDRRMTIGTVDGRRVLLFQLPHGALAVGVGGQGIQPLPQPCPTLWVTVPTLEEESLGFALNGDFDVDVGRASVSRAAPTQNKELARRIGEELGCCLCGLAETVASGWDSLRGQLGLDGSATWEEFVESLWQVLAVGIKRNMGGADSPVISLVRAALWGDPQCGMARFIRESDSLPTFLPGVRLTCLSALKYVAKGVLDDQKVFAQASTWRAFESVQLGAICSDRLVGGVLRALDRLPQPLEEVGLTDVMQWELGDEKEVDPKTAAEIGSLVTPEFVRKLAEGGVPERGEHTTLMEVLHAARFQAADGSWQSATSLLSNEDLGTGEVDGEEAKCFALAPDERRLQSAYSGAGRRLFSICRGQCPNDCESLLTWALNAADSERRQAALDYLLKGAERLKLGYGLSSKLEGSWLHDLDALPDFRRRPHGDQEEIRSVLRLSQAPHPVAVVGLPLDPADALQRIHAWWKEERETRTRMFEESICPERELYPLPLDGAPWRRNWLALFMLGAFHTMGRTRPQQHREFLSRCIQAGWLDVFAGENPQDQGNEWLRVLEEYLEQPLQDMPYLHWFRQFVPIFLLSRWLTEYRDAFLELDKASADVHLGEAVRPHLIRGYDAPPVANILGIGACFVVRELVRRGVLTNPRVHKYCFTPVRRVRRLFAQLGLECMDETGTIDDSAPIYEFLTTHLGSPEKATFCGDFDIPLQIIAEDRTLTARFFMRAVDTTVDDSVSKEGWM